MIPPLRVPDTEAPEPSNDWAILCDFRLEVKGGTVRRADEMVELVAGTVSRCMPTARARPQNGGPPSPRGSWEATLDEAKGRIASSCDFNADCAISRETHNQPDARATAEQALRGVALLARSDAYAVVEMNDAVSEPVWAAPLAH